MEKPPGQNDQEAVSVNNRPSSGDCYNQEIVITLEASVICYQERQALVNWQSEQSKDLLGMNT